jgi:Neocarzinostatin family
MTRLGVGRLASVMITGSLAATTAFLANAAAASVTAPHAAGRAHPHIVAKPSNLMVNTTTHLAGTGFRANAKLQVEECSVKSWIAPQQPCATGNVVTVHTDSSGAFKASLTAEVCPKVTYQARRGFMEVCYVGVAHPQQLDRVVLLGAAKITVTGP